LRAGLANESVSNVFYLVHSRPKLQAPRGLNHEIVAMNNSTSTPSLHLLSVYSGRECLCFILARGREGYEVFDHNEVSRGLFVTQREAAASLSSANDRADEGAAR
jgi:hypothetical protein